MSSWLKNIRPVMQRQHRLGKGRKSPYASRGGDPGRGRAIRAGSVIAQVVSSIQEYGGPGWW